MGLKSSGTSTAISASRWLARCISSSAASPTTQTTWYGVRVRVRVRVRDRLRVRVRVRGRGRGRGRDTSLAHHPDHLVRG